MNKESIFNETEIDMMKRMLNHPSIEFCILEINHVVRATPNNVKSTMNIVRSMYEKGAIDFSENIFYIQLSTRFATMAGVVSESDAPGKPLRWMPRSKAILLRSRREGRDIRRKTINETDLTRHFYGNHTLNNIPDHRREYDSVRLVGVSKLWHDKSHQSYRCEVCDGEPGHGEYCIRCNMFGGFKKTD